MLKAFIIVVGRLTFPYGQNRLRSFSRGRLHGVTVIVAVDCLRFLFGLIAKF